MAYEPLLVFNNGTLVGTVSGLNFPGGEGAFVIDTLTGHGNIYPAGGGGGGEITISNNGTVLGTATEIDASGGATFSLSGTTAELTASGGGSYVGGTGITVVGTTITNTEPYIAPVAGSGISIAAGNTIINASPNQAPVGGTGISVSGQTVNNSGVLALGGVAGNITLGTNLTLSGQTLNASGGAGPTYSAGTGISIDGSNSIDNTGVLQVGGASGNITLGNGATMSGQTLAVSTEISQGGTVTAVPVMTLGSNLTLSGTTLSASTTASANLTFELNGTSVGTAGTINALPGISVSVAGGTAILSSGGLIKIEQATLVTGSATFSISSCFTSAYDTYQIEVENLIPGTSGAALSLQFGSGGGTTWVSSGYWYAQNTPISNSTNVASGSTSASSILLFANMGTTAGFFGEVALKVRNPASTTFGKTVSGYGSYKGPGNFVALDASGALPTLTAMDSLQLIVSTGTMVPGAIMRVYGLP